MGKIPKSNILGRTGMTIVWKRDHAPLVDRAQPLLSRRPPGVTDFWLEVITRGISALEAEDAAKQQQAPPAPTPAP